MTHHRRQLLTALGTTGLAALAGCPSLGGKHTTKLVRANGNKEAELGRSVAMAADGTTALLGAAEDQDPNGVDAGAAYVFERAGGSWTQQAKLVAADGDSHDWFGWSVAMAADGTTALVGAWTDEDPNGEWAGSAYVFERAGGSWTQQAKLAAADGDSHDQFGRSVAMAADGTTALVGAWTDEYPNGEDAGSAYVFERAGGSWTQQAKLAAADGDSHDQFGSSVAMAADGTTALVGAPEDEDPNGRKAGSAYIFEQAGDSWTQQTKLAAADGDSKDNFGSSVAMAADGARALVGAFEDEGPNGDDAGAAYVFDAAGGDWSHQAKLAAADGDKNDGFGSAVAMAADGTTALLGAAEDQDPNGVDAGAAYVFERAGGSWTQQAKLAAADGDADDWFGVSVAMAADGTTALVGAPEDEDPYGDDAGSAYVFDRPGDSWRQ